MTWLYWEEINMIINFPHVLKRTSLMLEMWDRKSCTFILYGFYWTLVTSTLQHDLFLPCENKESESWKVLVLGFFTISMSESAKSSRVLSLISVICYQCVLSPDLMAWDYKMTSKILNDIISAVPFMNIWVIHSFFMTMNLSIPKSILVPISNQKVLDAFNKSLVGWCFF